MKQYICSVCGYVYDEAKGIPEAGIAPGTLFSDLPEDWVCPLCGASKAEFAPKTEPKAPAAAVVREAEGDMKELTALETSALCSNLAKGCEKQYLEEEAELFKRMAEYFKRAASPADGTDVAGLLVLAEDDLANGFPRARAAASEAPADRGALRALTWSEKVTRIQKSLLARYEKEGEAMLENTGVFVCTICGFIYIGDEPPALCPVCKVPGWKFESIEGRARE